MSPYSSIFIHIHPYSNLIQFVSLQFSFGHLDGVSLSPLPRLLIYVTGGVVEAAASQLKAMDCPYIDSDGHLTLAGLSTNLCVQENSAARTELRRKKCRYCRMILYDIVLIANCCLGHSVAFFPPNFIKLSRLTFSQESILLEIVGSSTS